MNLRSVMHLVTLATVLYEDARAFGYRESFLHGHWARAKNWLAINVVAFIVASPVQNRRRYLQVSNVVTGWLLARPSLAVTTSLLPVASHLPTKLVRSLAQLFLATLPEA